MIDRFHINDNQKSSSAINISQTMGLRKDMKKGGEILADGETVYKNGKWLG